MNVYLRGTMIHGEEHIIAELDGASSSHYNGNRNSRS